MAATIEPTALTGNSSTSASVNNNKNNNSVDNDNIIAVQTSLTRVGTNLDTEANRPEPSTAHIKNKGGYHPDDLKDLPPDGGVQAWTAAVCSLLYCFTSWGSVSSYSVFLNFYLTHNAIPGTTKNQYAMVAGLTMCFLLFWSWLVSALCAIWDIKIIMTVGFVVQFVGMLLASFSVNYWQLVLTEGVLSGIGCGFLFCGSVMLIPSWFLKRRTIASGMNFAGTGAGGCVFALVAEAMIQRTGDQRWALRTIAIICLAINIAATAFVKVRKPLNKENQKAGKSKWVVFKASLLVPVQPKIWFTSTLLLTALYFCLSTLGYVIILYSLSNFAVSIGLSSLDASHSLAVLNACQFFGRLAIGIASDNVGRFNMAMTCAIIVVVFCFAYWIPIATYGGVMSFSVFMGLVMGYQFVTIAPITADFFGMKGFPAAWSLITVINSIIGLVAELIALALRKEGPGVTKPYLDAQIFTGVIFAVSTLFLFPLRERKIRKIVASWKSEAEEELASSENDTNEYKLRHDTSKESKLDLHNGSSEEVREHNYSEKIRVYEKLLDNSIASYFKRMFYPTVA